MNKNKLFIIIIAAVAVLFTMSSSAKETAGMGGEVSDASAFLTAIGGDDAGWLNDAGEVCLKSDVVLNGTVTIKGGAVIVNGASCMFIRGFDGGSLFVVDGGELIFGSEKNDDKPETVIFDGGDKNGRAFEVKSGRLSIYAGAFTDGFNENEGDGGAMLVTGGEVNIYGGVITGCYAVNGGGAAVKGGRLTVSGGQIKLCEAIEAGGGVYIDGGVFELAGGTVGGEIIADEYASEATVMSEDGCVAVRGGGVYAASGIDSYINGGAIAANSAIEGGGVYIAEDAAFTLASGAVAYNNAEKGGGVFNLGDALGGYAELSYNIASETGGGLYNVGGYSMKGGLINSNEAKCGAGIYNDAGGSFAIEEGSVNYNSAANYGGGAINIEGGYLRIAGGSFGYNKLQNETKFGMDIYSVGELILENAVFVGGDGDVALGRRADGSAATAVLVPPFTCTTTIARLRPVIYDGASNALAEDYEKRVALTIADGDISEYDHLFKVAPDSTGGEWVVINGNMSLKPLGIWFWIVCAAALCAIAGGVIFAVRMRKSD